MQISIHTAPRVGCRCVVLQQSNIGTFGIWYYWLHWLPSMSGWVLGKLCQSTFLPLLEQSSMNPGSTAFGDPEDDRTWKWSPGCECKSQSYVACFLHVDAQILCMLYACCICVICGIVVWVQVCVCEVYECVQVCARLFLSRSLSRALELSLSISFSIRRWRAQQIQRKACHTVVEPTLAWPIGCAKPPRRHK